MKNRPGWDRGARATYESEADAVERTVEARRKQEERDRYERLLEEKRRMIERKEAAKSGKIRAKNPRRLGAEVEDERPAKIPDGTDAARRNCEPAGRRDARTDNSPAVLQRGAVINGVV